MKNCPISLPIIGKGSFDPGGMGKQHAPLVCSVGPVDHAVLTAEELAAESVLLAEKSPQEILRWAVGKFGARLTMATAFGAEGCCLIHMLAEVGPSVRIFNLDTGYQFAETLELRERIK